MLYFILQLHFWMYTHEKETDMLFWLCAGFLAGANLFELFL